MFEVLNMPTDTLHRQRSMYNVTIDVVGGPA